MAITDSTRVTMSREELYQQVWATPVSRLASRYGLSDVGLRKICQAHAVPVPRVGYWAKREHGKPVTQEPLPVVQDPLLQTIDLQLASEEEVKRRRKRANEKAAPCDDQRVELEESVSAPHGVVERTRRSLLSAKRGEDGLLRPRAKGCVDVAVAPDSVDRAMRLLDAALKSLVASGFEISTDAAKHSAVVFPGQTDVVRLSLLESVRSEERKLTAAQRERVAIWGDTANIPLKLHHPSGRLRLTIERGEGKQVQRGTWNDSERCRLESQLGGVVSWLIRTANDAQRERAESQERQKTWEAHDEQRRAEADQKRSAEQQQRDEEARFKKLEEWASRWERSERLRAFLNAVQRAAEVNHGGLAADSDLARWLEWGRQRAASLDPIQFQRDVCSEVAQ